MQMRFKKAIPALFVTFLLGGCGFAEAYECGYGGPGCGEPALRGLCTTDVDVGEALTLTVVYFDDTGSHPAEVLSAFSSDDRVLSVNRLDEPGQIRARFLGAGEASVDVKVEGWEEETFMFTLRGNEEVQAPTSQPASENGGEAEPDFCATETLRPDAT
jgi:hypothetical protein